TAATIDPAYYLPSAAAKIVADLAAGRAHRTEVPSPRELTFFDRFRSRRSQLTTPHIDSVAMPAQPGVHLGPEHNILLDGPQHTRKVLLNGSAIAHHEARELSRHLRVKEISGVYPIGEDPATGLQAALEQVRAE